MEETVNDIHLSKIWDGSRQGNLCCISTWLIPATTELQPKFAEAPRSKMASPQSSVMGNQRVSVFDIYVYQRRQGMESRLVVDPVIQNNSHRVHEVPKEGRRLGPISAWYEGKSSKVDGLEDQLSIQKSKLVELETQLSVQRSKMTDLEARLKQYEDGMHSETFLLEESPVYKSLVQSRKSGEERKALQKRNNEVQGLRQYVATMRYGKGPHHDESYYKKRVNELHRKIFTLAKQLTPPRNALTPDLFGRFTEELRKSSQEGAKTVQILETTKKDQGYSAFCDTRARRNFYMHLLSLVIYNRVLISFVFGVDPTIASALDTIQSIIVKQGSSS